MALKDADKIGLIRRFYKAVDTGPVEGGFAALLDGRGAKTPAAAPLVLPTQALANLVAAEWREAGETIAFASMPATRLAFTAIDRTGGARDGMAASLAKQAEADALSYGAVAPPSLVRRQDEAWTPWRDWAARELGLTFVPASGLMHQPQPHETLDGVRALAEALDNFRLTGLLFAAGLYESAILALAVQRRALDAVEAFELSRLEEAHQIEQWGLDSEAEARNENLRAEAAMLEHWFSALG
jgi:chaperone required for assembly of F1-ATPase